MHRVIILIQPGVSHSEPLLEPSAAPNPSQSEVAGGAAAAVDRETLLNLEWRLQTVEQKVRGLQQAMLQQAAGGGARRNEGSRVWYALTFAGWLMVPLVVVFMFHYRKTAL